MGLNQSQQSEILKVTTAVLHMGNITFKEVGNYAAVHDKECKRLIFLDYCESLDGWSPQF